MDTCFCFCSGKIEQALQRQPGVLEAKVSLLTRKAEVGFSPRVCLVVPRCECSA